MSGPFHSPAPWSVNASGGAMTIVARDRSVVAVIVGGGDAAPFEAGNGALMGAAPELRDVVQQLVDDPPACAVRADKPAGYSNTDPFDNCDCWACLLVGDARKALAKVEAGR